MSTNRLFTSENHDSPPHFTSVQRKRHLYIDKAFREGVLDNVRKAENKVFLALAYRYFCYTNQFFDSAVKSDIQFIVRQLKCKTVPDWDNYQRNTRKRHQQLILEFMGVKPFSSDEAQALVRRENRTYSISQRPFKLCFQNLVSKLRSQRFEIPEYQVLASSIEQAYNLHEQELLETLDEHLSISTQNKLDTLFEKHPENQAKSYQLTLLKKFSQKLRPTEISKNIEAFQTLHELFIQIQPTFNALNLNIEGLKHYAQTVQRSQVFQIQRRQNKNRHLHLVAFISHQYFTLQDVFVETLIQSVTAAYNAAEKQARDHYYRVRQSQSDNTKKLLVSAKELQQTLVDLESILSSPSLTSEQKVDAALTALKRKLASNTALDETVKQVESDLDSMSGEALFFHFLEEGSLKLQRRCNKLIDSLQFSEESINKPLLAAISKFKEKQGNVDATFPVDFMTKKELKYVDTKDKFKVSLYKVILFHHVMQAIKGDVLSIQYSYKYQALDDYLIDQKLFDHEKSDYLEEAEMLDYEDPISLLDELALSIHAQYQETNEHLMQNKNEYLKADGLGGFRLSAYRRQVLDDEEIGEASIDLFPEDERVHLCEVLSTVNRACGFLNEFEHVAKSHVKDRPEDRALVAGLIGKGCHFSQHQFSKLSRQIKNSLLVTTQNNYLTSPNCSQACNAIMQYVERMALTSVYLLDNEVHTSSDGMKYTVPRDSLNARNSFKYGGREPVVSAYAFSDSRNLFHHVEVISGNEREAQHTLICSTLFFLMAISIERSLKKNGLRYYELLFQSN
jgi:hypothetical protein